MRARWMVFLVAVVCHLITPRRSAAAAEAWSEITSPHFVIVTNGDEKTARKIAWQFEQIQAALKQLWPWATFDTHRPFVVFAVRNEATLKTLGPQYWEGKRFRPSSFGTSSADARFIALRTDVEEPSDEGQNPYQQAYWSYISAVLNDSLPGDPPEWYLRGLTEVMSNTIVREKEIHVGRLISWNLDRVREGGLVPFEEFFTADRKTHWLTQDGSIGLFDAQAWAFVHYLMLGEKGQHARLLGAFNDMLMKRTPHDVAFKEAFGDARAMYNGMRDYIRRSIFQYMRVQLALDVKREAWPGRPLSAAESTIARAEMLAAMDRPVEARALTAQVAALDSSHPGPAEIEAALLDRGPQFQSSLPAYEKAAAAGSRKARVHYRLAQLTWKPNAPADVLTRVATSLERTIELDPRHANAHSFLADTRCDQARHQDAVALARKAIALDSASAYHRRALARALWNSGSQGESLTTAKEALRFAKNEQERESVQEFITFAERSTVKDPRMVQALKEEAEQQAREAATKASQTVTKPVRIADAGESRPTVETKEKTGKLDFDAGTPEAACFAQRDDAACVKAAPVMRARCDTGDGRACRAAGSLYDGGFGVASNKPLAARLYTSGCKAGDTPSCARYAVLEAQGIAGAANKAKGLATVERLCGENVADACVGWGLLLVQRGDTASLDKARGLFQKACAAGEDEGCAMAQSVRD